LNLINPEGYTLKILGNNQVKIMPKNSELYSLIINNLNSNGIEYHTYQLKEERSFRVVLKNLHHTTDLDELKKEIESYNHKITRISNIKQRVSKKPLPMFFIDLAPNDNNKTIYDIQFLQHMKIIIEPPHFKKEIVQCFNCQRFGHSKKYCKLQPRCVKCSLDHLTSNCLKDKNTNPTCVHCEGNHSANYKGCPVYKKILNKKYPSNRIKTPPQNYSQDNSKPNTSSNTKYLFNPNISYAQKANINTQNKDEYISINSNSTSHQVNPQVNSNNLTNLEQTISKLVDKIDILMNIISVMVSKIN